MMTKPTKTSLQAIQRVKSKTKMLTRTRSKNTDRNSSDLSLQTQQAGQVTAEPCRVQTQMRSSSWT
jgi:hypothetical protein